MNLQQLSKHKVATLFALSLLVVATLLLWRGKLNSQAQALGQQAVSRYAFNEGESVRYRLNYSASTLSDFDPLFGAQTVSSTNQYDVDVVGKFTVTALNNFDEKALFAYSLKEANVKISANGIEVLSEAQKAQEDFDKPIFVEMNRQGKIIAVRFDNATRAISRSIAKALLAVTQIVLPDGATMANGQWQTEEEDPSGRYIAQYEVRDATTANDSIALRKARLKYLKPVRRATASKADFPMRFSPDGELLVKFDGKENRLLSIKGTSGQVMYANSKPAAETQALIELTYEAKEKGSAASLAELQKMATTEARLSKASPLSAQEKDAEQEVAAHRARLGAATADDLLKELRKLDTHSESANRTETFLKLKALMVLQPNSCARVGAVLAVANPQSLSTSVLAGALAAVGHKEAQAAIVQAIRARQGDWTLLTKLIPILGTLPAPEIFAEEVLRQLANQSADAKIMTTAQLALGAMAQNLTTESPERAQRIVKGFIEQLQASTDLQTQRQLLLALGNTGANEAVKVVGDSLNDSSATLRAVAAFALRWIEDEQAEHLLLKALTKDEDPAVRLQAVVGLGFREFSQNSLAAQKLAFHTEENTDVRQRLLQNLWRYQEDFPEVREILRQTARTEKNEEVKKTALKILAQHQQTVAE